MNLSRTHANLDSHKPKNLLRRRCNLMTTAFLFERWKFLVAVGCVMEGVARADELAYTADATGFAKVAQPFLQLSLIHI